jgi:Eukaryotic DNA topoisomerase I, catalytic core
VTVSGSEIEFCFRTKNRTLVRRTVRNAALARELRHLVALPNGSRLFRFERDGETANLTAPVLNGYIAEHLGEGFTAKDFRTWGGTLLAAVELDAQARRRARQTRSGAGQSHAEGGDRAREHARRRASLVREPCRRRALPRGPNARRLPVEAEVGPAVADGGRAGAGPDVACGEALSASSSASKMWKAELRVEEPGLHVVTGDV